jgi:hypothetical protein
MIATQATNLVDMKSVNSCFLGPSAFAFTGRMIPPECKGKFAQSLQGLLRIESGIAEPTEHTDVHAIDGSFTMKETSAGGQQIGFAWSGYAGMSIQKPSQQGCSRPRTSKDNDCLVFAVCRHGVCPLGQCALREGTIAIGAHRDESQDPFNRVEIV